ncbi:MAG: hypothetical protein AB8H79_08545, partial [Myxococcota bacterium]
AWTVDGTVRSDLTGETIPADQTAKGQVWEVEVIPFDGKLAGVALVAEATILNTPPTATATATLSPTTPESSDDLVVATTWADDDGDTVSFSYSWTVNGAAAPGESGDTVPAAATTRGETWEVTVTPNAGDDDGEAVTASVVVDNVQPVVDSVAIDPNPVNVTQVLTATATASDFDGDALTLTYTWYAAGAEVQSGASNTLSGDNFAKGDTVFVEVVANDGFEDSEPLTSSVVDVVNAVPSLGSATIDAAPPIRTETDLTCLPAGFSDPDGDAAVYDYAWTINGTDAGVSTATLGADQTRKADSISCAITLGSASDADGDSISYTYEWKADGTTIGTGSTLSTGFSKGQSVTITVTPVADGVSGTPVVSAGLLIANAAPVMVSHTISPTTAYTDSTITSAYTASDADGDSLTPSYRWTINGSSASATTASLASTEFKKGDQILAYVRVTDGTDNSAERVSNLITIANTAPTAPVVSIDPDPAEEDDDLLCEVNTASTDLDGDNITYDIAWELDGVGWTGTVSTDIFTGDTIPASETTAGDSWECFVTANDGTDDSTEAASGSIAVTGSQVFFYSGLYWVLPDYQAPQSDHATICSDLGLTATASTVTVPGGWSDTKMKDIATGFGYGVRANGCCVAAMWCRDSDKTCWTHNASSSTFFNWGYNTSLGQGIFTCT